jgi:hypothetical protein
MRSRKVDDFCLARRIVIEQERRFGQAAFAA